MTANEMADELELKVDRMASFGSPGYEDEDISSVLTEAEFLYVKKFIDNKANSKREGFDETEIRSQGFSALIKRGAGLTASVSQVGILDNGKFFDLPEDFMYTIHEEAIIDKNLCGGEEFIKLDVVVRAYDEISRYKKNKYKKPYYNTNGEGRVWRLVINREVDGYDDMANQTVKRHQLVTDGTFNVTGYSINYLALPKPIVVDREDPSNQKNCILDEPAQRAIVDLAADLLLSRVREQRLKNSPTLGDLE